MERGFRDSSGRAGPLGRSRDARAGTRKGAAGGGAVPRAAGSPGTPRGAPGFPHRPPHEPSPCGFGGYRAAPPPLPPPPPGCPREAPPLPAVLKGWGMGLGLQRGGAESRLVVDLRGWGPRPRSSPRASVGLIGSGRGMGKGCPGNGLRRREGGRTTADGFSGTFRYPFLGGARLLYQCGRPARRRRSPAPHGKVHESPLVWLSIGQPSLGHLRGPPSSVLGV